MSSKTTAEIDIKRRIKIIEDHLEAIGARYVVNGKVEYNLQVLSAHKHVFKQYQIYLAMLGKTI